MEHQSRRRRSRVGASPACGASFIAAASARAAGGITGSSPRSRIARTAMARSRARSDRSLMSRSYLVYRGRHILDQGIDVGPMRAEAQDTHAAEKSPV